MTQPQILSFSILGVTMLLFLWGRIRYDLVALLALLVSVACGTLARKKAFAGFSGMLLVTAMAATPFLDNAATGW